MDDGSWHGRERGKDRAIRGKVNHAAGAAAEDSVLRHYLAKGCGLVARRWRGKGGELDIVASDGDRLVFIEVKKSGSHGAALERVTERQVSRLFAAAQEFLASQPRGLLTEMRFDIGTVDGSGQVRILENAFV